MGKTCSTGGRHKKHTDDVNPLNAELNPICHLLALLGGETIVVVSSLRVKDTGEEYIVFFSCLTNKH